MIVDDLGGNNPFLQRHEVVEQLDEMLMRPFDPAEAEAYDRELWGKKNVEAAVSQGMYQPSDDPHNVGPMLHGEQGALPPGMTSPARMPT